MKDKLAKAVNFRDIRYASHANQPEKTT